MRLERRDTSIAIGLVAAVSVAVAIEFAVSDFLIDSKTSTLTPIARVFLVVGTSCLMVLAILFLLQRFLIRQAYHLEEGPARAHSRMSTVISLVRGVLWAIVVIVAVLAGLAESGMDIGPMLAGAGVVGIAIGLGAQSLLRDILAGVFFVA